MPLTVTHDPELVEIDGRLCHLYADGTAIPVMAGGAPDDDPEEEPDEVPEEEPDEEPEEEPDEDPDEDPDEEPDPPEDWDPERAARTIRNQRRKEREAREEAKKLRRERDELRQAQESEAERKDRERQEAIERAEAAEKRANDLLIEGAIREAALAAGIPAKRVKRALRLVDSEDVTIGDDGEVEGADDAVADLVDDFPELVPAEEPDETEEDEEPKRKREPKGGNSDRKRKPKQLTREDAIKLAKTNPDKFNELFEAGKIPASALGG